MEERLFQFTCEDCGYEWEDWFDGEPSCPKCGSDNTTNNIEEDYN